MVLKHGLMAIWKVGVVIKLKKNQAVSMIIPKKYHFQKFWKYMLFWLISL